MKSSSSTSSMESSSSSSLMKSSSYPTSLKPIIMKTKSNKRKPMLVIDGYNFQLKNLNSKKTIKFWRCANRACGVLLHTTLDDDFLHYSGRTTDPSHVPNPAESEVRNLRENMRHRAETEFLPLQEITEQEVRKALLTGEALAMLPGLINMGHKFGAQSTQNDSCAATVINVRYSRCLSNGLSEPRTVASS